MKASHRQTAAYRKTVALHRCPHQAHDAVTAQSSIKIPEQRGSPAAHAESLATKPPYYALVGRLIKPIIDVSIAEPLGQPRWYRPNNFKGLQGDVTARLNAGIKSVLKHPDDYTIGDDLTVAAVLPSLRAAKVRRAKLVIFEHDDLEKSLVGGCTVAAVSIVRNLVAMNLTPSPLVSDPEQKIKAMRSSFHLLQEEMDLNAYQTLTLGVAPRLTYGNSNLCYNPNSGLYERVIPLLDVPLTFAQVTSYQKNSRNFEETPVTLADITLDIDNVGCPAQFSGIRKIYELAIDAAAERQLII